ncbi:hypothetical protein ACWXWL_06735 [Pantoea ananatis]
MTAFQRSEVSMHFIPKLTRQRISELPEGTPIRIGARVVIFDGCTIEPNYKGEDETFVYYIDANGQRERHFEWLLLESGTEFIESELCEYCARFRHPTDIKQVAIRFWNRSEVRSFCSDKGCALLYQQTIRVPAARQGKPRRRIS